MDLRKQILTNNECYKIGEKMKLKGIMWHSTGANNPNISRYVQPDDGKLGINKYNNHWNRASIEVCVHGFIGKDAASKICTYQTLPWNYIGWHCGRAYEVIELVGKRAVIGRNGAITAAINMDYLKLV